MIQLNGMQAQGLQGQRLVAFGKKPWMPGEVADQLHLKPLPTIQTQGKVTHVVTFAGLQNPQQKLKPALQMRVTGVTRFQAPPDDPQRKGPINRLAESNWQDGQELTFNLVQRGRGGTQIHLNAPGHGPIGRVPDEIAPAIEKTLAANPNAFRFELSNVIAGTTKGAETIGLRVNLLYNGKNPQEEAQVRKVFNKVLNDPKARQKVMLYQPKTSPEEVLKLILDHQRQTVNAAASARMQLIVNNIAEKIKNPANKRILLIGHCKPDGDTLGCVAGMKSAIELMDPTRTVDCAVDDKIPGLFRNKVPGMDDIKHPYNPERIQQVQTLISNLQQKVANPGSTGENPVVLKSQLKALEVELQALQDKNRLLKTNDQYDLVIVMDTPTPGRFTDKFKPYLDKAKNTIYIDHHPHRFNEWQTAKDQTGLDMQKIQDQNLSWVADAVGACAQMMTIIGDKLVPQLNDIAGGKPLAQVFPDATQQQRLAKYVANLVTGMSTDTGSFTRTCNLTPEDMQKPVEERPNFKPEGTAKWLMGLTQDMPANQRIDKKWLRENVTYDLPDNLLKADDQFTARDLMLKAAVDGKKVNQQLSYGVVQVDYPQMKGVWEAARNVDPEVTLLDVQNGFKYSEVMGSLRSSFSRGGRGNTLADKAKETYRGRYDNDRIAVLICQDKKTGELDEKMQIATQNGLRLSIRSGDGSNSAELLCNLMGGGGHGAAAGARIDLPGIELNSPLVVKINGQIQRSPAVILDALRKNMAVQQDTSIPNADKPARLLPIELAIDPSGKPCAALLEEVVGELRKSQTQSQSYQRFA